jgi:hypothetical protein
VHENSKTKGSCSTDRITYGGGWLRWPPDRCRDWGRHLRLHLRVSSNLLPSLHGSDDFVEFLIDYTLGNGGQSFLH